MSNTFDYMNYPKPNPLSVSAGQGIRADKFDPVLEAANWCAGVYGHFDVVTAGWPAIDSVWSATETDTAYGTDPQAEFRIQPLPGSESGAQTVNVKIVVIAPTLAGNFGELEFRGGAASTALAITGGGIYVTYVDLDYSIAGGEYCDLKVFAKADPGMEVTISGLNVSFEPDSSPLPAGFMSDGIVPFAVGNPVGGETGTPDEPLSADIMKALADNLDILESRKHQFWQWSSWRRSSDSIKDARLPGIPNSVVVPAWIKPRTGPDRTLKCWIRASGEVSAEAWVVVSVGGVFYPIEQHVRRTIEVVGGAVNWYSVDLPLKHDSHGLAPGMPPNYETMAITVWPFPTGLNEDADFPSAKSRMTTAKVLSISIWGS